MEGAIYDMTRISSDVIRGYNDTMILYLLWDQPSYGYEISKQIKAMSDEKYCIKETTLYSAFTVWRRTVTSLPLTATNRTPGNAAPAIRITDAGRHTIMKNVPKWQLNQKKS